MQLKIECKFKTALLNLTNFCPGNTKDLIRQIWMSFMNPLQLHLIGNADNYLNTIQELPELRLESDMISPR